MIRRRILRCHSNATAAQKTAEDSCEVRGKNRENMEGKKEQQKVVVAACIRDEKGKILKANGKWEFPGGEVEFGESPEAALMRECREEIGCTIEIVRLLPYLHQNVGHRTTGEVVQAFVSCFEAKITEGEPKPAEREISELQWYKKEEIPALDSLPGTNEFINLLE